MRTRTRRDVDDTPRHTCGFRATPKPLVQPTGQRVRAGLLTNGHASRSCQRHNRRMPSILARSLRLSLAVVLFLALSGCAAVALTAVGVGMATGVSHTLGGIVYKTFAAPQPKVRRSTVAALGRMQIRIVEAKHEGSTEVIKARAADRDIAVEIEALTPNTTRLSVTAVKDGGLIRDAATATEIILQTEKLVGTG